VLKKLIAFKYVIAVSGWMDTLMVFVSVCQSAWARLVLKYPFLCKINLKNGKQNWKCNSENGSIYNQRKPQWQKRFCKKNGAVKLSYSKLLVTSLGEEKERSESIV